MRLSAKGRYAIAATIRMAENYQNGDRMTVIDISERLGISKIYLEQVFSLLKKGGVLSSTKGAQGGYSLMRHPQEITALDILLPIESTLFENTEPSVAEKAPDIEKTMESDLFTPLDSAINNTLKSITLEDLVTATQNNRSNEEFVFYI